jgi:hypothetical protein
VDISNPGMRKKIKMRKASILIFLSLSVLFVKAQRFFYVQSNPLTYPILQQGLLKNAQFVAGSPLGSDYIIKTDVGIRTESNALQMQIILQDSVTLKTIFQKNEEYRIGERNKSSRLYLSMLIHTFVQQNIGQIIVSAREDHRNGQMQYLKARKDKT